MKYSRKFWGVVLCIALAVSLFPQVASASVPAYYWDFEDTAIGSLPAGFTTAVLDSGIYHSAISSYCPGGVAAAVNDDSGNKRAHMSSFFSDWVIRADRWLITPAITVPSGSADLAWLGRSVMDSRRESYNVLLSTTGNQPEDFTVTLKSVTDEQADGFAGHVVSLDAYAGQDVYIAFQLVSQSEWLLLLDDIYIGPEAYFVTASATVGGTITPNGLTLFVSADDITYTITPDSGNRVASVLVDGVEQGAITSYTFDNVQEAHTIAASFVRDIPSPHALMTTFANSIGGATGNFFDVAVTGTLPVEIDAFDIHLSSATGNTSNISVYMREGTYVGHETSMDGWTLVGTQTVISRGSGSPTPLDIGGIQLQPGLAYGFLIYSANGMQCSSGGNTYADGNLAVTTGKAIIDSFPTSNLFTPYTWNGTIYYHTWHRVTNGDSGPTYIDRNLTNSSGITVSGTDIHRAAGFTALKIEETALPAALREAVASGRMILGYDVSLSRGFRGSVDLSFPVGSAYEGQIVTILHYVNGNVETYEAVVTNGMATVTVESLSPFAVLATGITVPNKTVIDPPKTGGAGGMQGIVMVLTAIGGAALVKKRKAK